MCFVNPVPIPLTVRSPGHVISGTAKGNSDFCPQGIQSHLHFLKVLRSLRLVRPDAMVIKTSAGFYLDQSFHSKVEHPSSQPAGF